MIGSRYLIELLKHNDIDVSYNHEIFISCLIPFPMTAMQKVCYICVLRTKALN